MALLNLGDVKADLNPEERMAATLTETIGMIAQGVAGMGIGVFAAVMDRPVLGAVIGTLGAAAVVVESLNIDNTLAEP